MDLASFRIRFPEFAQASDALVSSVLADAAGRTDPAIWRSLYAQGVGYLAADLLARSPFGRGMQMVRDDETTAYTADIRRMTRQVASGFRVT